MLNLKLLSLFVWDHLVSNSTFNKRMMAQYLLFSKYIA